jgi:hypothetical protein
MFAFLHFFVPYLFCGLFLFHLTSFFRKYLGVVFTFPDQALQSAALLPPLQQTDQGGRDRSAPFLVTELGLGRSPA